MLLFFLTIHLGPLNPLKTFKIYVNDVHFQYIKLLFSLFTIETHFAPLLFFHECSVNVFFLFFFVSIWLILPWWVNIFFCCFKCKNPKEKPKQFYLIIQIRSLNLHTPVFCFVLFCLLLLILFYFAFENILIPELLTFFMFYFKY